MLPTKWLWNTKYFMDLVWKKKKKGKKRKRGKKREEKKKKSQPRNKTKI